MVLLSPIGDLIPWVGVLQSCVILRALLWLRLGTASLREDWNAHMNPVWEHTCWCPRDSDKIRRNLRNVSSMMPLPAAWFLRYSVLVLVHCTSFRQRQGRPQRFEGQTPRTSQDRARQRSLWLFMVPSSSIIRAIAGRERDLQEDLVQGTS